MERERERAEEKRSSEAQRAHCFWSISCAFICSALCCSGLPCASKERTTKTKQSRRVGFLLSGAAARGDGGCTAELRVFIYLTMSVLEYSTLYIQDPIEDLLF